ncbi:MAG: hypothetical protein DSZ28_03190, partial [Thiothrix sp.]
MVADITKKGLIPTRHDIFTWLILTSVFFIPLQLPMGGTSRLSLADLFVVLASPFLLLRFHVSPRAVLIAPLLFPLVMVYGALLGGLINGQVLAHAMIAKVLGAVVLLFSLLSWLQVAQEGQRGIFNLMKAYLLGSVVFTLFGLVEFYAGVSIITVRFIESRFSGAYFDPNHYGALTGVGLVFIAALGGDIFHRNSSRFIVGGILGVGLLLCISRGAWIATVFGFLVVVVMRPIKIKAPVIALGVLLVIAVLLSGVLEHLAQNINDRPDNKSHRIELITEGFKLFKEGHFVGIGLSVFLQKNEIIIHNSVVWMLVEMGVVGIALYLLFIAEPVIRLMRLRFRHRRRDGQRGDQVARISAALLGAHLLMVVASQLVEATYQRQWWFVLALTVGLLTRTISSPSRHLPAYAYKASKFGTLWTRHKWTTFGWAIPFRSHLGGTATSRAMSATDSTLTNKQETPNTDNLNDTSVSDPTVRLDSPIFDPIEINSNQSDSPSDTSTPDAIATPAEDDAETEKSNIDTVTQDLPITDLIHEHQREEEANHTNGTDAADGTSTPDSIITCSEDNTAEEREIHVDTVTQPLSIIELFNNSQAEQETSDP